MFTKSSKSRNKGSNDTAGAAPRIGTVGKVRPVLLSRRNQQRCKIKEENVRRKRSISIYHNKLGKEKPRSRATAVQLLHEKCSRSCIQRLRIKRRIVSAWPIIYLREINKNTNKNLWIKDPPEIQEREKDC